MDPDNSPTLEEVLALDLVCLHDPDGGPLDAKTHRERLAISIPTSEWVCLRRHGLLVAYGYLWPQGPGDWFVGGIAIHPKYRAAPTIAALGAAMRERIEGLGIATLRSHVLRSNAASLRLHRKLGFTVEQENERAIAFVANGADLVSRLPV